MSPLPNVDNIRAALEAEERIAREALKSAQNKDDLIAAWWAECDHFTGYARARLQDIYSEKLASFGAMQP